MMQVELFVSFEVQSKNLRQKWVFYNSFYFITLFYIIFYYILFSLLFLNLHYGWFIKFSSVQSFIITTLGKIIM